MERADESKSRQPDPETLHTTDPQEHMKGPISSLMQKTKDAVQDHGGETPEKGQNDHPQNK